MSEESEAYAKEAKCSRLSASYFLDRKVPADYVREVMAGISAQRTALTVMETVALFENGVDVGYAFSCLRLGIPLKQACELWKDGVALDYVQTIYGTA